MFSEGGASTIYSCAHFVYTRICVHCTYDSDMLCCHWNIAYILWHRTLAE